MGTIVYNRCFGGFSLSDAGVLRYAERKGIKVYPANDMARFTTFWTIPPEDARRWLILEGAAWKTATLAQRQLSNEIYEKNTISDRQIPRDDPDLAAAVEELGRAANGMRAELKVVEMASGSRYRIDEYDGRETIVTPADDEWKVVP